MNYYDFEGLNEEQCWLILFQGWRHGQTYPDPARSPWPEPDQKTVQVLIDRELMTVSHHEDGAVTYHVDIDVHMAFCMSCEDDE